MRIAITRGVSPSIGACELTHVERQAIDVAAAREQHAAYETALRALGCEIERLPAEDDLPDSVFVEDIAIVFPELAILTRPGAETRRGETGSIAQALQPYRPVSPIQPPATVDGGDVLVAGKTVFIGLSQRTNQDAAAQMAAILKPLGYSLQCLPVTRCLHLKSAVTQVDEETLLLNPDWVDEGHFSGWRLLSVHPDEPFGANALLLKNKIVYPAAYVRTRAIMEQLSLAVMPVEVSELAKAEGGVTCCSLIVDVA